MPFERALSINFVGRHRVAASEIDDQFWQPLSEEIKVYRYRFEKVVSLLALAPNASEDVSARKSTPDVIDWLKLKEENAVQDRRCPVSLIFMVPQEIAVLRQYNRVGVGFFDSFARSRVISELHKVSDDFRLPEFAFHLGGCVRGHSRPQPSQSSSKANGTRSTRRICDTA